MSNFLPTSATNVTNRLALFALFLLTSMASTGCTSGHVGLSADAVDPKEPHDPSNSTCSPKTCDSLGLKCGKASDGCGNELDCGECEPSCVNNMWFYALSDADNDGYFQVDTNIFVKGCSAPEPYTERTDCDDKNQNVFLTRLLYTDRDGDGFGYGPQLPTCISAPEEVPTGFSVNDLDCDDQQSTIKSQGSITVYVDNDQDGYGVGEPMMGCPSSTRSLNNTDCDDSNAAAFTPRQLYIDADQDGYGVGALTNVCANPSNAPLGYSTNNTDCNDANSQVYTLGSFYLDNDGDRHGTGAILGQECVNPNALPPNRGLDNTDCNDSDPTGWTWRTYFPQDNDQDGYGVGVSQVTLCTGDAPTLGGTRGGGDCNDSDPNKFPGQPNFFTEATFGSFDYNCDGKVTRDSEGNALCHNAWGYDPGRFVEGWSPNNPPCGSTTCWARYTQADSKRTCVPECEYRLVRCQ